MSLERQGLRETQRATDGGLGIMDAFQGCFEGVLRDVREAQCAFIGSKAEAVLPKAEISKDSKGEFITFAGLDQANKNVANFDQWLDDKTRLKKQAA